MPRPSNRHPHRYLGHAKRSPGQGAAQQCREHPTRPHVACAGLEWEGALAAAPTLTTQASSASPEANMPQIVKVLETCATSPRRERQQAPSGLPSLLRSASRALPESAGSFLWSMRLPPPGPGAAWQEHPPRYPISSFSRKKCGGSSSLPRDDLVTWVAGPWLRIAVWGQGTPKAMRRGSAVASLSLFCVPQLLSLIRAALRSLSTPRFGQRQHITASG